VERESPLPDLEHGHWVREIISWFPEKYFEYPASSYHCDYQIEEIFVDIISCDLQCATFLRLCQEPVSEEEAYDIDQSIEADLEWTEFNECRIDVVDKGHAGNVVYPSIIRLLKKVAF